MDEKLLIALQRELIAAASDPNHIQFSAGIVVQLFKKKIEFHVVYK